MSKELFRCSFFVEDKNLAKVKRAVTGMVLEWEDQPVVNAVKKGNGVSAETNGNTSEMLIAWCRGHNLTDIRVTEVREFAQSIGRRTEAAQHIIRTAVADRVLKKLGKGPKMHYKVLHS